MKFRIIAFAGLAITTIAACSNTATEKEITQQSESATAAQVTEEANNQPQANTSLTMLPTFKITAMDGSTVNMADMKGKKVFVNLWATWCPPCRAEIPSIENLQRKVARQKVAFVMLSLDENFDLARNFANKNKMQLPVYYPAEGLPSMFNTDGIPATFIFNEKGELIKANNGMDDYDTDKYVQMLK